MVTVEKFTVAKAPDSNNTAPAGIVHCTMENNEIQVASVTRENVLAKGHRRLNGLFQVS